ncbi:DNA/RNA non-specific endonuclease, partial [Chryseobacterium sp. CCH4-E10]|uniref:DNA/RNA non-specific endonuclease n=1 Tax=Chryseobacterium sp. CCH4-E10 TaxID=1768758 RepID=UPI000AC12533
QRIENAIVKFWTFVKGKAGKLLSKIGVGGKDKKEKKAKEHGKISKGVEWWNDKITFENVENAKHTLYFKGEGKDAKLYMQSKDDHVLSHLSNAKKVAETKSEEESVNAGIAHYQNEVLPLNNKLNKLENDRIKLTNDNKDGKNDAKLEANEKAEKEQNKLQDLALEKLSKLFKAIKFDDDVQPTTEKTKVISKQDSLGRALEVEANPLTWIPGNTKGSSPYQNPLGWDHATQDIRNTIYIRGHMLNDNIHGPGATWNLVPITRVMNSNMEVRAESIGKQVLSEKGKNMIMWYKTRVVEYHKPTDNENDKYFQKTIKIEWGYYKNKDGQYDAKGQLVDINSATFMQGKPAMPYNINDLGETLLVDKLNLNAKFAKAVTEERKENGSFKNLTFFEERMTNYYANRKDKDVFDFGLTQIDDLRKINKITF